MSDQPLHIGQVDSQPWSVKGFILKTIVFVILLIIINRSAGFLLPTGWENTSYSQKCQYFLNNYADTCNTVFFGSSWSYAQINPVLFDSLNSLAGIKTNSYMLGSGAVFFSESLQHLNQLFDTEESAVKNVEYVYFELDDLVTLTPVNLYTPQASYYITPVSLLPLIRRLLSANLSLKRTITQIGYYVSTCIINILQIGYGEHKINYFLTRQKPDLHTWATHKGHKGLSYDLEAYQSGNYKARHEALMRDTSVIQNLFNKIRYAERLDDKGPQYNQDILQICLNLITHYQQRGVHMVYVLPLRSSMKKSLKDLYHALPDDHKIDMSEIASGIPELRHVEYWFDTGHLNTRGVRLYTRALAEEVQKHRDAWFLNSE